MGIKSSHSMKVQHQLQSGDSLSTGGRVTLGRDSSDMSISTLGFLMMIARHSSIAIPRIYTIATSSIGREWKRLSRIRWMLLLQEFNIEIRDKKGAENSVADHLSRIERQSEPMPIKDQFPDEQLLHINTPTPLFADIYNFVAASQFPPEASRLYKEKLQSDAKYYRWDDPYLWRLYSDKVIRRCILDTKINSVLQFCHLALGGGHYGSTRTTKKVLDCGFYWPTIFKDAYQFVSTYDKSQKAGMAMNKRHEMP
ncbi:hypothetical protein CR513_60191, partial [Mucuna pruriens]